MVANRDIREPGDPEGVGSDGPDLGALLDALFANSLDAVVVVDGSGVISYASAGTARLLGYDTDAVVGRSIFEYVHEEDVGPALHLFVQRLGFDGTDFGMELRVRHSSGVWVNATATASLLPESAFGVCAITLHGDPDENAEVERALRRRIAVGEYTHKLAADLLEAAHSDAVLARVRQTTADVGLLTGAELVAVYIERSDQVMVELVDGWLSPPFDDGRVLTLVPDAESIDLLMTEPLIVDSFDTAADPQHRALRDLTMPLGAYGLLSAPFSMGDLRGALVLMRLTPDHYWWDSDSLLCTGVASLFGRALHMARSENLLALTYLMGPVGFSIRTWSGSLVDCNQQYLDLYGLTRDEAVQIHLAALLKPDSRVQVAEQLRRLRAGEIDRFDGVLEVVRPDGTELWVSTRAVPLDVPGSSDRLVLTSVEDITTMRRQQLELEHAASHDPLTGVANRVAMRTAITRFLAEDGVLPALFTFDLDRFKLVNDSQGHVFGDRVLQAVVDRVAQEVRPTDVLARLGGDEFTIVVPGITLEGAQRFAERLRRSFATPLTVDGRSIPMTISIGVALGPDSRDASELLVHADRALYAAKVGGRNRYVVFDESMRDEVASALELESNLRHALERDEMQVYFQPEFAVDDRRILGAEALLRWDHPTRGLLPASEFIDIAEQSGMIDDIGRFALRAATRSFAAISDAVGGRGLVLRVNISGREFMRPELADLVRSALHESGLAPGQLCLEMTELTLMDAPELVLATFGSLRQIGVQLAIDDFGTGFSSLAYLKRFPVDILKIDRAFIEDIVTDPDSRSIVESIVGLSQALGLDPIAEGVETEEQLAVVGSLGIERAQGYLVACALSPTEFFAFLTEAMAARPPAGEIHDHRDPTAGEQPRGSDRHSGPDQPPR